MRSLQKTTKIDLFTFQTPKRGNTMKKRLISIVLLIAMLMSLSLYAFAETVMLDRSQPSYDEETE